MKTLLHRTSIVALTAALTILGSGAGYCGDINPQPLPPCHHMPMIIQFVLNLVHQLHV